MALRKCAVRHELGCIRLCTRDAKYGSAQFVSMRAPARPQDGALRRAMTRYDALRRATV